MRYDTQEARTALRLWQDRLKKARAEYAEELEQMENRTAAYEGTHKMAGEAAQDSTNVRNIVYELVESQVEPSVPLPKVTAIHKRDTEKAQRVEALLRCEVTRLRLALLNDSQERVVPVQGGAFWQVEWNPTGGTHCTQGALRVRSVHPRQLIPQPGVAEPEEMDYLFLLSPTTRAAVERQYGVRPAPSREEEPTVRREPGDTEELVTVYTAYYKNGRGGVGRFSWAEDTILEDWADFAERRRCVCARCGLPLENDGVRCTCGGRAKSEPVEWEMTPAGHPETMVRCYKPEGYPLVLRRNVSRSGRLLGTSDADVVADQQECIKKLGSKLNEKVLKGGSFVTLPTGVGVETSDRELKIIRLRTPAEKALIDVLNIQPDVTKERVVLEDNYAWAKSTLGITDSYQGKYDSSAVSGTAKQFAANQAAGRLESKRRMKNAAYAELYRKMFQYLLAYSDGPVPITRRDADGETCYGHFDRWEFLERDESGTCYWNDEFLFKVDTGATLAANREAMWAEARQNFQLGAFGPVQDTQAQIAYWTTLERYVYPGAGDVKKMLQERLAEARAAQPLSAPKEVMELGMSAVQDPAAH